VGQPEIRAPVRANVTDPGKRCAERRGRDRAPHQDEMVLALKAIGRDFDHRRETPSKM
jgi:hypothetical protein